MEFGVLWNDKCMLILKNGQNQISWGDNSHINDHKINSDICLQWLLYQHNNSKRFLKNLENCERVVVFRKVGEQKILKLGYILQANINSILVWISEQYYHHLLSPEVYFSYCNHHFEAWTWNRKNSIFVSILLMGWNYPTHLNRAYSENQWTKQSGIAP